MTQKASIVPVLALAFVVFVSACSDDPVNTNTRDGIPFGTISWRFKTEAGINSTAVSANGIVYAADQDGILYAVDIETGELRWKFETTGAAGGYPAVQDGLVYFGSYDGTFYAIDALTGQTEWQSDLGAILMLWPALSDEAIYITTTYHCLYALNAKTGEKIWMKDTVWGTSAPAIDGNIVSVNKRAAAFGTNNYFVYGYDAASGTRLWEFSFGNAQLGSPAMSDGNVYVGYDPHHFVCLNAATGEKKWEYEIEDRPFGVSHANNGTVVLSDLGSHLYAVNTSSGELKWKFNLEQSNLPVEYGSRTAAIHNGVVYTGTRGDGSLSTFFALDEETGSPLWQYDIDGGVIGGPTVANGKVLFGSMDGYIYALNIQ